MTIKDILLYLSQQNIIFEFEGNEEEIVNGFSSIKNYKKNSLTWIKDENILNHIDMNINIKLAIVKKENHFKGIQNKIITNIPRETFFNIVEKFYFEKEEIQRRGNNCNIDESARLDDSVIIGNNCTIKKNVTIGKGTIIGNNVVISSDVSIGNNCNIKSGVIIGENGFGYIIDKNEVKRELHFGSVNIKNGVDIGANTCIDRGTIDDTYIGNNVKIGNMCHIGHNVIIKENSWIGTGSFLAGSSNIKENCKINLCSVIRDNVIIGKNTIIAMGSVVTRDFSCEGKLIMGIPARIVE